MIIYFCSNCGAYSMGPSSFCEECQAEIPIDNWSHINDEELHQLAFIEDFDLPPGLPTWEYEVILLKPEAAIRSSHYTREILNRMGDKGWELVSIVSAGAQNDPRYGVFKRSWPVDYDEEA